MTLKPTSTQLVTRVVRAVADAADSLAVLTALALEISDALQTPVAALVRSGSSWRAVTGSSRAVSVRWESVCVPEAAACSLVRCNAAQTVGTLVPIGQAAAPVAAIVVEGDWLSIDESLLAAAEITHLALNAAAARAETRRAGRQLVRSYAMARRLSRLDSVERVAQQTVDCVARLVRAERVSLALYNGGDDALSIVATYGYPRADVADVRVRPGAWVLGHVFSSKRALFVSDVRVVPEMARRSAQYRTFSFAAVPLMAGRETVGVLTVTDKMDGQSFNHADEMILRGLSTTAAVSILAARSSHEAAELAYAATIDSLTGLMNRPSLDHRLHQEVERSKRESTSLAVLMVDVDDFKRINDTRGHQVGDAVLRAVGAVIRSAVRVFDVCARYGGDEFAVVMPNCERASAVACAERIGSRLRQLTARGDDDLPAGLTLSIGVAVIGENDGAKELIERADRCLYQAKADGKNTVRSDESREEEIVLGPRRIEPKQVQDREGEQPQTATAQLPYVLLTDADENRVGLCLQAVQPFQCGLLVARTGALAASLIERFGPPVLLTVDLMLPSGDAFAAINALPEDGTTETEVVAWSASREAREFAASRIRLGRVLNSSAGEAALTSAIQGALQRHQDRANPQVKNEAPHKAAMPLASDVVARAREICQLPGVAVYLKDDEGDGFRVTFDWAGDDPPKPTLDLPSMFNRVRELGRTVFDGDTLEAAGTERCIRGVIGIPLLADNEPVGVLCLFDVQPLRLDAGTLLALEELGAGIPPSVPNAAAIDRRRFDSRRPGSATILDNGWPPTLLERSGGEFAVARELSRARREGRQLSVVLFSVGAGRALPDHPDDGDLNAVAETLLKAIRQSDLPIRWSVTELLVVLPGLGSTEARSVAERVRAALAAGARNRVAVSGGVEEFEHQESFLDVVDRARQKVALAVDRGHNRVV